MTVRLRSPDQTWTLPVGVSVIGRHRDCQLKIADPRLSRRHARFVVNDDGSVVVQDLGGINGTLVNGDRINGSRNLNHGDLIIVGPCALEVLIDNKATTAPPPQRQDSSTDFPRSHPSHQASTSSQLRPASARIKQEALQSHASGSTSSLDAAAPDSRVATPSPNTLPEARASALTASQTAPGAHRFAPTETNDESTTSVLKPSRASQHDIHALQPNISHSLRDLRRLRAARLIAGSTDTLLALLGGSLIAIPLLICATAWALFLASAGLSDGRIDMSLHDDPASFAALITALMRPGAWSGLSEVLDLLRNEDRQAFLVFFIGATLAVLAWILVPLFSLVAATMIKGAPWCHRRCGLTIRNHHNGFHLGPVRSLCRWLLALLLAPAAVVCIVLGRHGPHDILAGSRVQTHRP